jgi:hypothetical protein
MNIKNYPQLELFSYPKNKESQSKPSYSFFNYMRNYEKIILRIIIFIITAVVSFSLGVEKGKRMNVRQSNFHLDMALKLHPDKPTTQNISHQQPVIQKEETKDRAMPVRPEIIGNYTIQVASFATSTYAQKEAEKLKKKGLSPQVLSKGRFEVLYVGKFSDKESAKPVLTELKKIYRDCFIRRL